MPSSDCPRVTWFILFCVIQLPQQLLHRGAADQRQTALLQQGAVTSSAQVRQLLLSQAAGESRAAGYRWSGQKEMEPDPCTWALQPLNKQPMPEAGLFSSCCAHCRAMPALLLAGTILCLIHLPTPPLPRQPLLTVSDQRPGACSTFVLH